MLSVIFFLYIQIISRDCYMQSYIFISVYRCILLDYFVCGVKFCVTIERKTKLSTTD